MTPKTQTERTAQATQSALVTEWSQRLVSPFAQYAMQKILHIALTPITDAIIAVFDKKENQ